MVFAGYFLIVADFIKWAKANDIPVGPGRGSGGGAAGPWCLPITHLNSTALCLLCQRVSPAPSSGVVFSARSNARRRAPVFPPHGVAHPPRRRRRKRQRRQAE